MPSKDAVAVGGVGTYMLGLLDLLQDDLHNTVICNHHADIGFCKSREPNVDFVEGWTFGSMHYAREIESSLAQTRHDVVHLQHELFLYGPGPIAFVFPLLLRRLLRRHKVAVTIHGVVTEAELHEGLMKGRKSAVPFPLIRFAILWIFRCIARSRAHKIVHSEELRNRLVRLGAKSDDVTVIDHPLIPVESLTNVSKEEARALLGIPIDAPVALTWGFWNSYKGHDVLVEGFSRFKREFQDAILLMGVGPHPQLQADPDYRGLYDQAMSDFAEQNGVTVLGFINEDVLPLYVRAADVAVFAYTRYIAASGPMSFSLSAGTPVLLSDVFSDAPSELQFKADPNALASALAAFFRDHDRYEKASALLAEQASADVLRAKYMEVYRTVANVPER